MISRKKIALVHVARRDLGLSDEEYRAILQRQGGVSSAAELDEFGFEHVMRYVTALGFRSDWTRRTFGDRPGMASPAQIDHIRQLWRNYLGHEDEADAALNAWLDHFHHISALRFVDAEKAGKVIPALRVMAGRK